MEKFMCFVLCLAAFVSSGSDALKCYTCESDKLDGCIKSSNPKEVVCGPAVANFQQVCSYKVTHDTAKKTDKVRSGCDQIAANAPLNQDSLAECKNLPAGTEIKECRVCATELCNSSPAISTSMVSFLCLPLMYLVSKVILS